MECVFVVEPWSSLQPNRPILVDSMGNVVIQEPTVTPVSHVIAVRTVTVDCTPLASKQTHEQVYHRNEHHVQDRLQPKVDQPRTEPSQHRQNHTVNDCPD